ncbi:MAG: Hsp20/alpha crystallin family protein, partial [Dehalococcoidia bacterium]
MVQLRSDWRTQIDIMQQEMQRLLNHLAGSKPPRIRFSPAGWEPAIDVYETDDEIVVIVELAGVKESDIEILVDRDRFTIRGERRKAVVTSVRRMYYQMEIMSGPFARSIALPVAVDTTESKAYYADGLVEVVLPKAGKGTTHKVDIK